MAMGGGEGNNGQLGVEIGWDGVGVGLGARGMGGACGEGGGGGGADWAGAVARCA